MPETLPLVGEVPPERNERPTGGVIVDVVGVGDDGPVGLSAPARKAVENATLLCGGKRHLAFFPDHPAERLVVGADLDAIVARLRACEPLERPVVLASGDPCYFGIAPYLAARLGREGVRVEPHVGSVQLAFSRLAVGWQDALVLSAHGRRLAPLLARAMTATKVAFLTDQQNTPAAIARALLATGHPDCEAHVFEHLGNNAERHTATRLAELPEHEFAALNILVLLREATWSPSSTFGLPEDEYLHRDGQITKPEVRAVSLSKLRLRADAVVWDIGAGCGSISIEAAGLVPEGHVFAIERDTAQLALLQTNLFAMPAPNLTVVAGEAPRVLTGLPDPDAVFIGGSGGRLSKLLSAISCRLRPRGRLVANFATLEHLAQAVRWVEATGWERELVHLSVARGVPVAGLTRLAPLSPVFVLAAMRPEAS